MRASIARFGWPAVYAAVALLFFWLLARFYHPVYGFTALFQLDPVEARTMLPALRDRPVYVYGTPGGYDGMFYAQFAVSPLLRDPALPRAIDNLGYRGRRILGSWVAWLAGLGNPDRALDAYALLNPFCWAVLALLALRLFPPRSTHDAVAWGGLLLSAGVLGSVRLALTDLPALVLVAAAALALERGRTRGAVGFLAAAALARETSLVAALPLVEKRLGRTAVRFAAIVAPLAIWGAYVRFVAGPTPPGLGNLGWPGLAFFEKWRACLGDFPNPTFPLVPWFMLAGLIALTAQVAWILARPNWGNVWWRIAAGYAVLLLCLGSAPWEGYPGAAARVVLPLQLAFNVLAPRTRWGLVLLLAGNLGFFSGLDQMHNPPSDRHELAAARIDGVALLARTGEGCFDIEHHRSHRWCWSGGNAYVHLTAWHQKPDTPLHASFNLSGFTPRTVTVRLGETILWSGPVARKPGRVEVALPTIPGGDADLVFTTDRPGIRENASPGARTIAFSIGDFRFEP